MPLLFAEFYQNFVKWSRPNEKISRSSLGFLFAARKGNWVMYPKIPRYTIETPPYSYGRIEFDEDGPLCKWEDVQPIIAENKRLKELLESETFYLTAAQREIARLKQEGV